MDTLFRFSGELLLLLCVKKIRKKEIRIKLLIQLVSFRDDRTAEKCERIDRMSGFITR